MQVSVENLDEFKRKISVVLDGSEVRPVYNKVLHNYSKNARIAGFRKGKIPTNILLQQYGKSIEKDVTDQLLNDRVNDALKQSDLQRFADMPAVQLMTSPDPEKGCEFSISVDVMPELALKPLNEIEVERVSCSVSDDDVNRMLETLRRQHSTWSVVDDLVIEDDTAVSLDFDGKIDGKSFEGGKAEKFLLTVGITPMLPGFVEGLKGHKAGDEFAVNVTFPENYKEDLRGKTAVFDVKVHSVARRELPELNEDFLRAFEFEGSLDQFRADLKTNMEREAAGAVASANSANLSSALAKAMGEFAIPESSILKGKRELVARQVQSFKQHQMYKVDAKKEQEMFEEGMAAISDAAAANYVRQQYVFNAYVEKEDFSGFSEQLVSDLINSIAGAYDEPEEFKKSVAADKNLMSRYREQALNRYIVSRMLDGMKCSERHLSFSELLPGTAAR